MLIDTHHPNINVKRQKEIKTLQEVINIEKIHLSIIYDEKIYYFNLKTTYTEVNL